MARNEQLIRQHKILQILERYRFGRLLAEVRDDLVDELGLTSLHPRTVRRDLEALQAAGVDVDVHNEVRGKVWKLGPRSRSVHKISATATELIALSLGRDLLHPLAGTPFWQGIESFWNKLQDELPDSVWEHYKKYRRVLHVIGTPAKTYKDKHGILATINRAMAQHRVVEIDYQPVGKPRSQRSIEPMGIVFYQSSLYIVAAAHELPEDADRVRHWKLDRFHKATALDKWFTPPDESEIEKHLAQTMGAFGGSQPKKFRIRVSSFAAQWVLEDPWHPDQKVARKKDGSIILTVQAGHELEIIQRVLALGSEAEVLSPASCRRTLASIVERMAQMYNDESK